MIEMILVPLDGSPYAEQALAPAVRMARHTGAAILLHLSTADENLPAGPDYPLRSSEHEAQSYLHLVEHRLRRLGIATHSEVSARASHHSIVATAALREVSLIAMSLQGRSGARLGLSGVTAQRVIAESPVPLLLVQGAAEPAPLPDARGFRRLLVPLDGTREAETALGYLQAEALAQDSVLTLLRVVGRANGTAPLASSGFGGPLALDHAEMATQHHQMEAYRYLDATVRSVVRGASCRTRVEVGYPAKAILDMAAAEETDLIVMASGGTAGACRPKPGSVAWHVLQNTRVPVLLLRPEEIRAAAAGKDPQAQKIGERYAADGMRVAVLQRVGDDD
jgi:nucleotide-binding universal stress UspA family protein